MKKNSEIFIELRLKEIKTREEELDLIVEGKDKIWFENLKKQYPTETEMLNRDIRKEWDEYRKYLEPENSELRELSRERRKIQPIGHLVEIPNYGTVMTLKDFVYNVECGGFINSDGYGNYIKNEKQTDIEVYPSDVKNNNLRSKEFDSIIWFNR